MTAELKKLVESTNALPPLPLAVTKLNELAQNPDTTIEQIDTIVSLDPVLTTQILKVANSAFYGFSKQINTIRQAVVILGFRSLRNIAMGTSLMVVQNKIKYPPPLNADDFWLHSLTTACIAKVIAKKLKMPCMDEMFVIGLIHDVGKLLLLKAYQDSYQQIVEEVRFCQDRILHLAEYETFGFNHSEVGEEICLQWKLPVVYATIVKYHHENDLNILAIDVQYKKMIEVLQLANNLAKVLMKGYSGNCYLEMHTLGVAWRECFNDNNHLVDDIYSELENAKQAFAVKNSVSADKAKVHQGTIYVATTQTDFSRVCQLLLRSRFEHVEILDENQTIAASDEGKKIYCISDHGDKERCRLAGQVKSVTWINPVEFMKKHHESTHFCHVFLLLEYVESYFE